MDGGHYNWWIMNDENRQITMSDKQLQVMREALEFYSRFLSGQIDCLPDDLLFKVSQNGQADALRDAL